MINRFPEFVVLKAVAFLVVLSFVACSSDPPDSTPDSSANNENNTTDDMGADTGSDMAQLPDLPEGCWIYDQDVSFDSQAAVDLLLDASCVAITGELTVTGAFSSLAPLESIQSAGAIRILDTGVETVSFPSLISLGRLQILEENLDTVSVPLLSSIEQLSINGPVTTIDFLSLTSATDLRVAQTRLIDLRGFAALETIAGDFFINGNSAMFELSGLETLATVGGSLVIKANTALTNLDALAISAIGGSLVISDAIQLDSLDGLSELSSVGESVAISGCSKLVDLDGLQSVSGVGDRFHIFNNDDLTSLTPVALQAVNTIVIRNNDSLTSLFGSPVPVDIDVILSGNSRLSDFEDVDVATLGSLSISSGQIPNLVFDTLSNVGSLSISGIVGQTIQLPAMMSASSLTFSSNSLLTSVDVPQLPTVSGIVIYDNPVLTNVGFASLVSAVDIEVLENGSLLDITFPSLASSGDITFIDNPSLMQMSFPTLTSLTDDLEVIGNASLADLNGFDALTQIADRLHVEGNPQMVSLAGMESLVSIDDLELLDNVLLGSLTGVIGLTSLQSVVTKFQVSGNISLLDCRVDDLLNQLPAFNGTLIVSDNGGIVGCP